MAKTSEKIFCAFCKLERRHYAKKHLNSSNVLLSLLTSMLLMFVIWNQFNPFVIVIFVLCLALAEIFIKFRWRLSANCPYCNFDPVLYKTNPDKACQKVIYKLENLKLSGQNLLATKNPLSQLAKRQTVKTDKLSQIQKVLPKVTGRRKGQIIQREI